MRNFIFNILFFSIIASTTSHSLAQDDSKVRIKANKLSSDRNKNIINAIGNVEVSKSTQTITTDKIKYNKNTGWINSESQIELTDQNIGTLYAKKAKVKDDFSSAEFIQPILIFNDGSYVKSDKAIKKSITITEFEKSEYSICPNDEIVKNDNLAGNINNLITLKTYKTSINEEDKRIKSSHILIKLSDIPIFYLPYLSIPSKGVKRKSGFLSPSYTNNSRLGFGIKAPYFININEYTNLTVSPIIYSSDNQFIIETKLHQKLKYGEYRSKIEIANNEISFTSDISSQNRTESDLRYKLISDGEFILTENDNINFNILTVGDKDYLRDFNFYFLPYTESELNYEYVNDRDYLTISSVRFQELENFNFKDQSQWILPSINHHIQSKPKYLNEIYSLNSNFTAINRESGIQYRRLSTTPKIHLPVKFIGNLIDIEIANQIDYFNIEYNFEGSSPVNKLDRSQLNRTTFASALWSLPLIKKNEKNTYVIEPKIKYDHVESSKNSSILPNEESNNSELTVNNLFFTDRLSGFDRSEEGSRVTYGVNSSIYQDLSRIELDIGQSYIVKQNSNDLRVSGYNNNKKSNIIGRLSYNYDNYFYLNYNFQLDESNLNNKVNSLNMGINYKKTSFSNSLLLIRPGVISNQEIYQNTSNFSYKFNSRYILSASLTKDLVAKKDLRRRLSIKNDNCCVVTEFSVSESNISNLATKERSINLNIILKEVGF